MLFNQYQRTPEIDVIVPTGKEPLEMAIYGLNCGVLETQENDTDGTGLMFVENGAKIQV